MPISLADAVVELTANREPLQDGMRKAEKETRGWVGRIGGVIKAGMTAAVAIGGTAIAGLGAIGVKAFESFQESRITLDELRASFGDTAEDWIEWSDKMQAATAYTDESFQSASSEMRTLISNYGLAEDQVRTLIEASADMAAMKGMELTGATHRLQAAMRGEAESAEALGLTLNDAYMKNIAFNGELQETWETLSDAEKAQYRYEEALNQMAYAEGEAAKKTQNFRGAIKQIRGVIGDFLSHVGSKIAPTLDRFAVRLADRVPHAAEVATAFVDDHLFPAIERVFGWMESTAIPIAGRVARWLGTHVPRAIQAVSGLFHNTLLPAIRAAFGWMRENAFPVAQRLRSWLEEKIPQAIDTLVSFWGEKLLPATRDAWGWVEENVFPTAEDLRDWLAEKIPAAIKTLRDWWNKLRVRIRIFVGVARAYLSYFANQAEHHLGRVVDWAKVEVPNAFQKAKRAAGDFASGFDEESGSIKKTLRDLRLIQKDSFAGLQEAFRDLLESLGLTNEKMGPIKADFEAAGRLVGQAVDAFLKLSGILMELSLKPLELLVGFTTQLIDDLKELPNAIRLFRDAFVEGLDKIGDAIPSWLKPGSPTPFELGVRGIVGALQGMPEFNLGVETPDSGALQPALAGAGGGGTPSLAGAGGERTTVQFYGPVTVEGVQDGEGLLNELTEMARG